jgi:sugar phosphate isomerase/epimerase
MRWAICNETFQDWPFEKACTFAAELGYTGLEIAPFTLGESADHVSSAQRERVRREAESVGLEIIGLHWLLAKTSGFYLTSPDATIRQKTSKYLADLARLCRDLGGHVMVLGSPQQRNLLPGVSHADAMRYAADCLQAVLPTLEDCQVVVAVEPLGTAEGDFLNTAALGAELCSLVGSPHCRLHLDVKAMSSESIPMPEIIHQQAGLLEHFHANDPNKQGPGMGEVDFLPILRALGEIDYRGWVSVEVFDYTPGIEALASESIHYLEACLAELAERH